MRTIIWKDEETEATLIRIEAYGNRKTSFEIQAPQNETFRYAIEHELDERGISNEEAVVITKGLIEQFLAREITLCSKSVPEPTWWEIQVAEGEVPDDWALKRESEDDWWEKE